MIHTNGGVLWWEKSQRSNHSESILFGIGNGLDGSLATVPPSISMSINESARQCLLCITARWKDEKHISQGFPGKQNDIDIDIDIIVLRE